MRKVEVAAAGGFLAGVLCAIGWYRHRPRRTGALGGYRCELCGRAADSLDELETPGQGYVSPTRRTYTRDGAGGHAETTRSGEFSS